MTISCVTVSFILKVNKAACSSNLAFVVSLFFIKAIFDFRKTKLPCFELVCSGGICFICNVIATFCASVDLKLIYLSTVIDDNFNLNFYTSSADQLSP